MTKGFWRWVMAWRRPAPLPEPQEQAVDTQPRGRTPRKAREEQWRAVADAPGMDAAAALFAPYQPPSSVRGAGAVLAQDSMASAVWDHAGGGLAWGNGVLAEGLTFRGYPTLAAMMLRAEFRKPVEIIAREATREWIRLRIVGPQGEGGTTPENMQEDTQGGLPQETPAAPPQVYPRDAAVRLRAVEQAFARLEVRDLMRRLVAQALGYGMGHVWIGLKATAGSEALPLRLTSHGVGRGQLERLSLIDPVWTTPADYNALNPLAADYYRPTGWWVQGTQVHATRLLSMVPYEVPDLLKPAYNFGGLALPQMLEASVQNFLRTRQAVSDMIGNYATRVLRTDMAGGMADPGGAPEIDAEGVSARLAAMTAWQSSNGTFVLDRETEDFSISTASLTGLSDLQAQAQEFMAAVPGIPLVKLFGLQPQGLNASSEGEIRVFYDEIAAFQQAHMAPVLRALLRLVQLDLWGWVDPALEFEFVPLWQMSEQESAAVERQKADMDEINIRSGKITPAEARAREAADGTSLYRTLGLRPTSPDPARGPAAPSAEKA
jgi:phage-related protein (TIGR01555 family)